MRILVTGGAGFIGSHVVDAYVAAGHEVAVVDDLSTGKGHHVNPQAAFYLQDVLDRKLAEVVSDFSPEIICHHAAQMDLRRSVTDPLFDARINILGLIHLLEACKKIGLRRFIYASSGGAVYGEQEVFPASEDHPTRPLSPYGVSKLSGEHYLAYYYKTFGISYAALRYSNVYGPRQNSSGEAGVVAIFADHLLRGHPPVVNGDGAQTRDYIYVGDVVEANLLVAACAYVGPLNIGTGRETSVLSLFAMLRDAVGSDVKAPQHGPTKLGEQRRSMLDIRRAREVLEWSPRVSLKLGLEKTANYYRQVNLR